jgi:hypothetical protein
LAASRFPQPPKTSVIEAILFDEIDLLSLTGLIRFTVNPLTRSVTPQLVLK